MQLEQAPLQFVGDTDGSSPAETGRKAALTTLAGCSLTILAAFLPWVEKASVGVSLTTIGFQYAGILLAVLAMVSGGIAGFVLLRRPATARLAIGLVALAAVQLGLAIWVSANIVHAIAQVSSHQVLINAIGTGFYATVLGAVVTLAGGILAWTNRRRE